MAGDNELPIDVFINLDPASLAALERRLQQIGAQASQGEFQFSAGEQRVAANAKTEAETVALLAEFKRIQIAAGLMAAEMKLAADAAGTYARKLANQELPRERGPRGQFLPSAVREDQVAARREIVRIAGEAGTLLGRGGTSYAGTDADTVYRLASDRAQIRSRQDAYRVGAQIQLQRSGILPGDIQFTGESLRAKKDIERYFTDVAAHIAERRQTGPLTQDLANLEHLVNVFDPKLIGKATQKLDQINRTERNRAEAADAEAAGPQPTRGFRVADLTSRNQRRFERAQTRLAQDLINGVRVSDEARSQINPTILAREIKNAQRAADRGRRRDQADYLRSERESALAQLQSEDPEIRRAGVQAAERARRRGVNAQIYRGYIRGDDVEPDVIQRIAAQDPDIIKREQDRARKRYYDDLTRKNAEEARRLYGTGADTAELQQADLQSKNQELRRAAHRRLAKDVLAGRTVDPNAAASIDPDVFREEADKEQQRQRRNQRRARSQADQDLRDRALAGLAAQDPLEREAGIQASELLRRREEQRKIFRGALRGNAVDPSVLAGIPQDIQDDESLAQSAKQARARLRRIIETAQQDAGVLSDVERYAKELLKADEFNATARKTIADAELAGKRLPAGATAALTAQDRADALERQANRQTTAEAKQRRDKLAQLNKAVEAEVGPLEEAIRYQQAVGKFTERRRNAYRDSAASLAADDFIGPLTQSRAQERARTEGLINQYDPGLLRRAELEHQQDELARQRADHARALNAHFGDPNVPFTQRFSAGFSGKVPGGVTQQQPFGADFLRGLFGREGSLEGALGQAVKFSVLYGGLYRIQGLVAGGFAAAAASASQYEDALIALSVATGKSVEANEELASSTSKIASAYGFLPDQGVTAAAQAVGLYGLNDVSEQQRNAIAGQSTAVAARLARVSGQDIGAVQQNIAGLVRSFNLPALDQTRIEDMLTVVQRQTGSQPADLINAATQLGPIATSAGYDLADTFSMIAQAQRLTGQTANAVAGQLSQGLSKAGDPATKAAFASVGVNVTGTSYKEQVAQLAALRGTLDEDTFKRVVQSVGRSRSGSTFDVLLSQQSQIQGIAAKARSATPGSGEEAFNRTMETLSGQLLRLKGSLAEIGVALAQAGLLEATVHVVTVLNTLATIVANLVGLYNELPKPLREAITWGTEFYLVLRLLAFAGRAELTQRVAGAFSGGIGNTLKALSTPKGIAGLLSGGIGGVGAGATRVAAPGAGALLAGQTVARSGAGSLLGLSGLGAAAAGLAPGLVLTAAAGLAYGGVAALIGGPRARERTVDSYRAAELAAASAGTPEEIREAASAFGEAVRQAQEAQELSLDSFMKQGLNPWFQRLLSGNPAERNEAEGQKRQQELEKQAKDLEAATLAAGKGNPALAFASFASVDAVSESLRTLSDQGLSAAQQLEGLNTAFEATIRMAKDGQNAAAIIQAGGLGQFTNNLSAVPAKALARVTEQQRSLRDQFALDTGDELANALKYVPGFAPVADYLIPNAYDIKKRVTGEAESDLAALGKLDPAALQSSARKVVEEVTATATTTESGAIILTAADVETIKNRIRQEVKNAPGFSALPPSLQSQIISALAADAASALGNSVQDLSTPQGINAYAQNAAQLAATASQNAGAQALLTANENTAAADVALVELQRQRKNVLDAAQNLKTDTPEQRAFKANYIKSQTDYYDGEIRKAYKSQLDGRAQDIDVAVQLAQSGHALDDEFGRAAEEYLGAVAKLYLLTGHGSGVAALKAADDAVIAGIKSSVNKSAAAVNSAADAAATAAQAQQQQNTPTGGSATAPAAKPGTKAGTQAGAKAGTSGTTTSSVSDLPDHFTAASAAAAAAAAANEWQRQRPDSFVGPASRGIDLRPGHGINEGPPNDAGALAGGQPPSGQYSGRGDQRADDYHDPERARENPDPYAGYSKEDPNDPETRRQNPDPNAGYPPADKKPTPTPPAAPGAPGASGAAQPVDPNSPEVLEAQAKANEAALRIEEMRRQAAKNKRLLELKPNDVLGIDRTEIDEAQGLLDDALRRQQENKAKGVNPLIQEADEAQVRARRLALREKRNKFAQDYAGIAGQDYELSLAVDDPMADAKVALDQATRNLALAKQGIGDQKAAQLAYRKAQQEVLQAQVEVSAAMRDDYDRTDPTQQAQAELDKLNAQLKITKDPKARKILGNQIEDKGIERELAESNQKIKDIDDLEALGKISKQAAQAARLAEKNRIDAELAGMTTTTTGYRALKDRSTDLAKEIKSASEQFSGQFNLRDIKLPTVYEIRRSLGTDRSDITGAANNTTNNVQINGADFARVVAYLQDVFGKQVARTRAGVRTVG